MTLGKVAADVVMMTGNPALANRMHPVRAVRGRATANGHGNVAGTAFHHDAGVPLNFIIAHIVVGVRAGELCMSRAVAGFALQPAVTAGKTE